jgi:ribosomal protein S18 acetylase RimI-like enzyme
MADLNEFDVFFINAGNALEIIGGLPSSYFYRFPEFEDSFIMATGIKCADENWAWIKRDSYSRELLVEVIRKFECKSLEFFWPIFPGSNTQMEIDMDELGLLARETLSAMIFDSNIDAASKIDGIDLCLRTTKALSSQDALLWANTCWKGFMDEEETPQPEFIRFAQNAVSNDKLSLFTGFNADKPVGVYMLCESQGLYISHFCVLPKFRGMGVGSLFMNEIMNYNSSMRNRFIVLLATKSGRGLYRKFGFRSVAEVHIRSFSEI